MNADAMLFADVTIAMITMDEESSIRCVVRELRRDAPGAAILIVDSSTDRTPIIATEEGVEVIRQFPPRGYGPAMATALMHPSSAIVVTLDCDGTYPTGCVPTLVEMVRSGYDVAGTTRIASGRPRAMHWTNYVANRLFNCVASLAFLRPVRDVHSGMRAYRRETIHGFHWLSDAPALPVELLLLPIRAGLRVGEIPIAYGERIGASTLHRFESTIWTFRRIARTRTVRLAAVRRAVLRCEPRVMAHDEPSPAAESFCGPVALSAERGLPTYSAALEEAAADE